MRGLKENCELIVGLFLKLHAQNLLKDCRKSNRSLHETLERIAGNSNTSFSLNSCKHWMFAIFPNYTLCGCIINQSSHPANQQCVDHCDLKNRGEKCNLTLKTFDEILITPL